METGLELRMQSPKEKGKIIADWMRHIADRLEERGIDEIISVEHNVMMIDATKPEDTLVGYSPTGNNTFHLYWRWPKKEE
jgi:hypothetical protein